jgi:hypothetical protein
LPGRNQPREVSDQRRRERAFQHPRGRPGDRDGAPGALAPELLQPSGACAARLRCRPLRSRARDRELRTEIARRTAPRANDPRAIQLEAEIRQLVRSLPVAERSAFVGRAIEGGDHATVAACLAAPPALLGIAPELVANLRTRWERKLAPEQGAAVARLERAAEAATSAGQALLRRYDRSYDHTKLDGSEGRSRRAAKAEAIDSP